MSQEALPHSSAGEIPSRERKSGKRSREQATDDTKKLSTLIEFPGTTRAVPEWRKQLSQRVREVQERKAREAAEELAAAQEAGLVSCSLPSAQLELVPDLEQQVMNPIVSKALERIERARRSDHATRSFAATTTEPAFARDAKSDAADERSALETKPKLIVVAPKVVLETPSENSLRPPADEEVSLAETKKDECKPVRVISDRVEDIALSYLETCLSVPALAADTRGDTPGFARRILAGLVDLLLVAIMVSPAAAAIYSSSGNWSGPTVIGLMSGMTAMTIFGYFTISVALTGKTIAMRIFSLRTIDLRTGLIPTGGQSIRRALAYVFSLALFGLGLAYAFIDPDHRTIHDRLSNTIVILD